MIMLAASALPAAAADIYVNSTTSLTSWDLEDGQGDAAAQYIELYTDTTLGGYKLDLSGYGRAAALEYEGESDDISRLYSLTVGLTSPDSDLRFLLGRQFVPSLTGPEQIDGLLVEKEFGKTSLAARYGHLSEISSSDANDDLVLGLGASYLLKRGMYLSLDYSRTFDEDALLREQFGVDLTYSWHRHTKAYAFINWDLMSETIHEALFGANLFFSDRFTWILEYSQSLQQFDSDSIYSVFAVDAVKTTSFVFLFTPTPGTRYTWEYALEGYKGGSGGRSYSVDGRWTPGNSTYELGLAQHTGFGGDLTEITAASYHQLLPGLDAGIGGDLTRSANEGEGTVKSYAIHTGLKWSPSDRITASLRYEQSGDDSLDEAGSATRLSLSWEL
jgi:hypothetical protein